MEQKNKKNVIVEMSNISKAFSGISALNKAELRINEGEVHALMGENGAGKSTLMKILCGVYIADSGDIKVDGRNIHIKKPKHAQQYGITMIHQELNLIPGLTVMENMYLGREPINKFGFIDKKKLSQEAQGILNQLGVNINLMTKVGELSVGAQQMVEIAKALTTNSKVLIMDEPTAALSEREAEKLFKVVENLTNNGVAIIYISHRMEEVFKICHKITVMRDGQYVGTKSIEDTNFDEVVRMMAGRELTERFPKKTYKIGDELFKVEDLNREGILKKVSFKVSAGEVLGIAGLMGAGRTELARAIFGIDKVDDKKVFLEGKQLNIKNPTDSIKAGIALITEDRKHQGLVLDLSIKENFALPNLKRLSKYGFIDREQENREIDQYIKTLKIKTSSREKQVKFLSGGNQQKVVLAKWLAIEPKVIILDEPTRGVDVAAKAEIYNIINMLAAKGKAIIMISSELPEVLGMSDRILVMHEGQIKLDISAEQATQEEIIKYAAGGE